MKKTLLGAGNRIHFALALGAISLLAIPQARATNLFWSGNGTTQGGAGTWTTSATLRFGTAAAGPYTTQWVNGNVDSAQFGNAGGQVNIAGPIVVNLITTDLAGFNIGNANAAGAVNTITFSGANAGVFTNYAGGTTTISAVMNLGAGAGSVTKSGAGRMEMGNGSNPTTIKFTLNGGAMTTASAARLSSAAPGALVSDFMTFNGGGWGINTGNQDTGANRGITVKSGGAFFGSSSLAAANITISSPIVGTEGGGITLTNVGPFVGNAHQAGVMVTLSNTGNTWNGDATISSGTLRLGASGVVPDTAVIHLTTAGTFFNLSNAAGTFFNETVKSIDGAAGTVAIGTGILTIANPAGETHAGVVTGTSGGQLIKNGGGAWTLSGSNTGWQGEFILNTGTIGVGSSNSFGNQGTAKVTINGGNLSNTGTGGRSVNAAVPVALNGDFSADDSLFVGPGQILFNGIATMSASRTITVNGTANLGFADLRGVGLNVIKNGGGILALTGTTASDPNAFTGTATVNAGKLSVTGGSYVGNGSNTVILNGGALNTSATRTVAFENPISMTAASAITTTSAASTPNFDFGTTSSVGSQITNGSNFTLTLRNDGGDAASDQLRVRFFGSAFNFAFPIDMPNGSTSSTVELASFNTTGTQTYSGTISGTGAFRRSASTSGTGGETVLSGNNTFSGGTSLNDGKIGFGSSSTATTGPIGTGTLTISSANTAMHASGGARTVSNAVVFTTGTGTEFTGSNDLEMSGTVNLGAVNRTLTVTNTANTTLSGVISDTGGTGGIIKAGPGVLTLTGANTYGTAGTTSTTVTAGKLLVNNTTGSGTGPGDVSVTGGTLGGNGTIAGSVTVTGGSMGAGNSIGTLNLGGTLSLTSGSFDWEFTSGPLVLDADLTNVGGALNVASATTLAVTNLGTNLFGVPGSPFVNGSRFTVISYSGAWNNGTFGNASVNNHYYSLGGQAWRIKYDDTPLGTVNGGAYANAVTLTAVPEAGAFLVMGLGGVFAVGMVRMAKRRGLDLRKVLG